MQIGQMKVGGRLAVGFGLVLALMSFVAAIGVWRLSQLNTELEKFAGTRTTELIETGKLLENVTKSAMQLRNLLLFDDQRQVKAEILAVRAASAANDAILAKIGQHATEGRGRELFAAIDRTLKAHVPQENELLQVADSGDHATAKDMMLGRVLQTQLRFIEAIKAYSDHVVEETRSDARRAAENYHNGRALIIALALLALFSGAVVAVAIARGVSNRLGEKSYAAQVANTIASGDLTTEVAVRRGDDEAILAAMKRMRDDLVMAVGAIRGGAEQVGTAARQIAAGNADLAGRTEEQASSLEETAASMEELASTVRQNAENAAQADQLAQNASRRAEQGGNEVSEVVATMGDISRSAARIADIISVIDGIAFQTNILALNAAVEAARAGEQGRGFAVVASEVRSLAHRTSEAAREIKQLIGSSVERVGVGTKLVEKAGATIETLVSDVKEVGSLMRAIAESSAEQSRGVQQVNKTVTEMDKVVQQNAGAVQESASAAEAMRTQAESLIAAVSAFRLDAADEARVHAEPAARAAPATGTRVQPRGTGTAKAPVATAMAAAAITSAKVATEEWEEF